MSEQDNLKAKNQKPKTKNQKRKKEIEMGIMKDAFGWMFGLKECPVDKIDVEDLEPENFNSASAILELVQKLRGE